MKRRFPEHVSEYKDQHGKYRLRYRRTGVKTHYFKSPYGSPEFEAELTACRLGETPQVQPGAERAAAGTIADLIARYYRSLSFTDTAPSTQRKNRGIFEGFRAEHGSKRVAAITFEHLDAIFAKRAKEHPAAALNLRKQIKRLLAHAVKLKMRPDNPADMTAPVKKRKNAGYHPWSEEEIAQYRATHKLGTKARLSLELLLWTDQRKSDMVKMGRKDVLDGRIVVKQAKGGKELALKMPPQLHAAISAMPVTGVDTFLVTDYGKPFTANGFGNKMREWCNQAGLPQCSSHGLRKAQARRAADLGASQQGLKAMGGWSNDKEVAGYVASANQKLLADRVIDSISDWELANLQEELARLGQKVAENGE